jgi:hypothetical protein
VGFPIISDPFWGYPHSRKPPNDSSSGVLPQAGGGSETVDTSEEEQNSWSASDQEVRRGDWVIFSILFGGFFRAKHLKMREKPMPSMGFPGFPLDMIYISGGFLNIPYLYIYIYVSMIYADLYNVIVIDLIVIESSIQCCLVKLTISLLDICMLHHVGPSNSAELPPHVCW